MNQCLTIIVILVVVSFIYFIYSFCKYVQNINGIDILPLVRSINLSEDERNYIEGRVNDQIRYYDKSARKNKILFYVFQILIILLGAFVSISSSSFLENVKCVPFVFLSSIAGAIITILTTLLNLFGFLKLMTEHRIVCEKLKMLVFSYVYREKGPKEEFHKFRSNIEDLILSETQGWASMFNKNN